MSNETALVPINAEQDSALALARTGTLLPPGLSEIHLAPEDEDDMDAIASRHPVIRANAKFGTYPLAGEDAREAPRTRIGVALARSDSRILFPASKDGNNRSRYQEFKLAPADVNGAKVNGLADAEVKWLCACSNTRSGGAVLNPQLSPAEKQAALEVGLGGATGKGCHGCPLGRKDTAWSEDDKGRFQLCKEGINFLWLDNIIGEPSVLQFISGTTIKLLREFLGKKFKKGGKSLSAYTYPIRFGMRSEKKDGNDFCVATADIGPASTDEEMELYRSLRPNFIGMLAAAVDESRDTLADHDEPEPAAPAPVGDSLDPIDPRDPLPDSTPSEFDLF